MSERHRVVVVGGGFGGLQAVKHLAGAPVDVTLVDRRNFHLFQPLVYQVATGSLSPGEIATPLRSIFKDDRRVRVMLAEATGVDFERRELVLRAVEGDVDPRPEPYDTLIVATGSFYSYFGHDEWRPYAHEVKSLESALDVRHRILGAFEAAELETDAARRGEWLSFAVVGAGPTGVEMAGQIAEIARDTLAHDFREIDPAHGRVLLVDQVQHVLPTYPPSLSAKAEHALEQLGVTPLTGRTVVGADEQGITVERSDGHRERMTARTVIWAAGVEASPLGRTLGAASGAEVDRAGRVTVEPDLTLPGHPDVIVLGDMARVRDPHGEVVPLPGVAPVAMQQGRYAARLVRNRLAGRRTRPFHYLNKGDMATIGRARAVVNLPGRIRLAGPLAWLFWLGLHLFYLIGFENRLLVVTRWAFSFVTRGRGARLITGSPPAPPPAAPSTVQARSSAAAESGGDARA